MLGSALTLAQALASAVTGWIADTDSVRTAMLLPLLAAVLVLAFGAANLFLERRARQAVRRTTR